MSDLFCIEGLRVAYPQPSSDREPVWAVDGVSLSVQSGERLGLVGESGCGKSTLGRAALRLLPPSSRVEGRVLFEGESVLDFAPDRLRRFRGEAVALVFQDPMTRLDPVMTIGEHCLETLLAHQPHLSQQQAKEKAIATLAATQIPPERWSQYPHEFSGGMRQRVAIALALLLDPKLIVADEPTTSLDVTIAAQILQELTRLCQERSCTLILISHDLALVGEYCDRVAVMYQGKIVEMGAARSVLQQPQHPYSQALLEAALHLHQQRPSVAIAPESAPLLRLMDLHKHYTLERTWLDRLTGKAPPVIKAVNGVSLDLYPGEILGLVGESGCGKSTLSRTVLNLVPATSGRVEFLGQALTNLSPRQMRSHRRQLQMIFQDPHACLNPQMTVGRAIADPLIVHKLATPTAALQQAEAMLERVGLSPASDFSQRRPSELSGGQQQRVAIARALITHPQLVICDEPVSMLDASVQATVLQLMLDLKQEFHLTYLFITHDLWVARFLCDRIAVMYQGAIVELAATEQLFQHPQHPYTQKLLGAAPLLQATVSEGRSQP